MPRLRRWLGLILLLGLLPAAACAPPPMEEVGGLAVVQSVDIDEEHVFEGEINRRGKPVGFHHRAGGRDLGNARLLRVNSGPNRAGVYTAQVEIRESEDGPWKEKFSSLFPDAMSRQEVLQAIARAFESSGKTEKWSGPSGHGFTVEGYYQQDRISTAYPVYRAGE